MHIACQPMPNVFWKTVQAPGLNACMTIACQP
jgi:hypothetical protein